LKIHPASRVLFDPVGEFTSIDGEDVYRISGIERMAPFLMNIPSETDLWMFVTSRGGLTAGRVDPDGAIFPYEPVDRLQDAHHHTGPVTMLRVRRESAPEANWEPWSERSEENPGVRRSLAKNLVGNAITFEEVHHALGLSFRSRWSAADSLGIVRTATLVNQGPGWVEINLLDGLRNVLPHGAPLELYQRSSSLVEAYRRTDCDPESRLAIFSLTARILDRAEAAESLRANVAWCDGLPDFQVTLDGGAVRAFRRSDRVEERHVLTGRRGNYFMTGSLRLAPGDSVRWHLVADAARSHLQIAEIRDRIVRCGSLDLKIEQALAEATQGLRRTVAAADGLQVTAAPAACAHHFTNVLFNNLRGGAFTNGYQLPAEDFRDFLLTRNRDVAKRHGEFVTGLPSELPAPALVAAAEATGDPDLQRLALEYLPLRFGRRHGDPSRPWNRFAIRVRNGDGTRALHYEGNWRDIFQNWEALAWSFPDFLPNFVAKFVNAMTVDGFNPYRITREGIDWELEDPDNPWSYIGYWGDHQIIYLLKLLEALTRFAPGALAELLERRVFSYADVPYRIRSYEEILRNPRATIRFHRERAADVDRRVAAVGTDGRLLPGPDGRVLHVTLLEKLLVPALSKLSNLVPGGGIWMNTQRPEWNDANNALVGNGLSVVTMCYLRRYLVFLEAVLEEEGGTTRLSTEVAVWFEKLRKILAAHPVIPADDCRERKRWLDEVGEAFSEYRTQTYGSGFSGTTRLERSALREFCRAARELLDREITAQRRDDGLYHSYNVLELEKERAAVHSLDVMLEGQVAALSSGAVNPAAAAELVDGLFASSLYREDQRSFLLYPERELPSFLEKNAVPEESVRAVPLLEQLLQEGDVNLVARDVEGDIRFHADFANARDVEAALDRLKQTNRWKERVFEDRAAVLRVFEEVFRHRSFTGRSGIMYGYEGLGCVYWHMVAKLLLAVQEISFRADREGERPALRAELAAAYYRVRSGLGFEKTAAEYGAFPTDPYSHTPAHGGARQPGMTGQVKEEILTRLGELGMRVRDGVVRFRPVLLNGSEFCRESCPFQFEALGGDTESLRIPGNGLAFTFCQVPVVYVRGQTARIRITRRDGTTCDTQGDTLGAKDSERLFARSGEIQRIDVEIPADRLLP
jgi:hypothetical protein